ncbi:uncharacterized protein [Diabrotica undecimpunctata]|uniref:uncharacterized protein n=1 Tax=Diabrotica undecimpunctata TaxID=50387 RepID=UPI003B63912A
MDLWWNGPNWLNQTNIRFPLPERLDTDEEKKRIEIIANTTVKISDICERFLNLNRIQRVLSHCIRFADKCKKREVEHEQLTVHELENTLQRVIKNTQELYYAEEIKTLKSGKPLNGRSKLLNLLPYVDNHSILRVTGRLQNSDLTHDEKHPLIIPHKSKLSKLIIQHCHTKTLHGGIQQTLHYIKKRFWITHGKRVVREEINTCVKCKRYKAETAQQLMGSLPRARVNQAHPFANTGVDYAGPIKIIATKGRGYKSYKGYIAVFVCLATKAVHLEVVELCRNSKPVIPK